jgi:hypothetical protein
MYVPRISPRDPQLMFVGCDMRGLYRTTDAGLDWQLLDTRTVDGGSTRCGVAFDPNSANRIVGVHRWQGLKESTDAGATWHDFPVAFPKAPGADDFDITAIAFSPDSPATLLVGTSRGVFELVGNAWSQTYVGSSVQYKVDSMNNPVYVNDGDVVTFAFAKPSPSQLARRFVATILEIREWDGTNWNPISGSVSGLPARLPGPYNDDGAFARRIRDLVGTQGTAGVVLYATVLTDATALGQEGGCLQMGRNQLDRAEPRTDDRSGDAPIRVSRSGRWSTRHRLRHDPERSSGGSRDRGRRRPGLEQRL